MDKVRAVLGDILSGSIVSVITVSYCISFAALIFSGRLEDGFSLGLTATLIGAGVAGIAIALGSSLQRAVGGPDTPIVAVFGALAISVTAAAGPEVPSEELVDLALAAICVGTLATGVVLTAIGALRIGNAFRFIPYSVIAGFLAASGCLLIAGGYRIATQRAFDLAEARDLLLAGGQNLEKLCLAFAFVLFVCLARLRCRQFFLLPASLCLFVAIVYGWLWIVGRPAADAAAAGWFMAGPFDAGASAPSWRPDRVLAALPTLAGSFGEIAAVAVITALAVLLNTTSLEAMWKTNSDLDREYRITGLANLASGALGGIAGNVSLNRSLLNRECGAAGRLSAIVPALVSISLLFFDSGVLAAAPTPALAGLLLFLGVSIIVNSLSWGSLRQNWPEFLLTILIAGLILLVGYLEGLFVGMVGAALLFAYNYSRIDIVKREFTRQDRSSTVERPREHARLLIEQGMRIHGFDLHGYLFFATSSRLVEDLKRRLQNGGRDRIDYLLIDFRLVSGIDTSTALSFAKLRNACEEAGATLLMSGMQPPVAGILAAGGQAIVDGRLVRRFHSLDEALEWAEDALLRSAGANALDELNFEAWIERMLGDAGESPAVLAFMERLRFLPDERLVAQGDAADSVDLLVSGRIKVVLERPGAAPLRLRSMLGHTVLGEMGFYRGARRAATVIAEEETVVLRLDRKAYERMREESPAAAAAFDRFIIRILADRLTFANTEIAALNL